MSECHRLIDKWKGAVATEFLLEAPHSHLTRHMKINTYIKNKSRLGSPNSLVLNSTFPTDYLFSHWSFSCFKPQSLCKWHIYSLSESQAIDVIYFHYYNANKIMSYAGLDSDVLPYIRGRVLSWQFLAAVQFASPQLFLVFRVPCPVPSRWWCRGWEKVFQQYLNIKVGRLVQKASWPGTGKSWQQFQGCEIQLFCIC